jgi:hypothetical protein
MNCKRCDPWVLIVLVIGVALFSLPAKDEHEETTMIIGTVAAADTDEDGNATAVVLKSHDRTHSIDLIGVGEELLSFVGETVKIQGAVREEEEGWAHVEVLSFVLVPEMEAIR